MRHTTKGVFVRLIVIMLVLDTFAFSFSKADVLTETELVRALTDKKTRNFSSSPTENSKAEEEKRFIESLMNGVSRRISMDERGKIIEIAKEKPAIDIDIPFEYKSAVIGVTAIPSLISLGKALQSVDLKTSKFLIAGHTDAYGGEQYNLDLSVRRAGAVRDFLIKEFGVEGLRLLEVGYGKEKPKNIADPFSAENRRVQIVNLTAN